MAEWIEVAATSDLSDGRVKVAQAGEKRLALAQVGEEIFAMEDLCTHDNGPLGEGTLHGTEVECPRHGARFNVKTGQAVTLPAIVPVKTFPVKISEGKIYVEL